MAERRAGLGGHRQHRRDARHDRKLDRAAGRRSALDDLEDGGRHREHAGIAAGDDRDFAPSAAWRSAAAARSRSSRLSEPWRAWPARAGTRSR